MITYTYKVNGGKALPCTPQDLKTIRSLSCVVDTSERLREITEQMAWVDPDSALYQDLDKEKKAIKLARPAIIPHASSFVGMERKNQNATPSGLVLFDKDHHKGDLRKFYEERIKEHLSEWQIAEVELSASGDGLHILFVKPDGMTIQEAQKWMAQNLGTDYDEGTFDLARAVFVVPEEYVLYQNDTLLFGPSPQTLPQMGGSEMPKEQEGTESEDNLNSPHYGGDAEGKGGLSTAFGLKVFDLCLEETGLSQSEIDIPGERNWHNTLKAILSVGLCQFIEKEQLLAVLKKRMPNYYETEDCRRLVSDFYKNYSDPNGRMTITQRTIYARAIKESQKEEAVLSESQFPLTENNLALPRLPRLLQVLVRAYPAEFRPAVIISSLVFIGTLLSRLRAHYLDGSVHSPSFFACVVAPQASGKSFSRRLYELLTAPIKAQDKIYRKMEQDYKKAKDSSKNSRQQPVEPETHIRLLPATTSNAIILKRADMSGGLHLCTYAEEIDTLTKGQKAGAWSQKSDLYRMAFDNAEWGQDYMSDNSYSGVVQLFYNLLVCGTPNAMNRYFSDVEDGLVSRVTFVELPDMMGARMPKFANFSKKEAQEIKDTVQQLYELGTGETLSASSSHLPHRSSLLASLEGQKNGEASNTQGNSNSPHYGGDAGGRRGLEDAEGGDGLLWVNCPKLISAIDGWLEDRRQEYLQNQDNPALEIFRRRSAVIGFRAGLVAYALAGMRYSTMVSEFALWVANFTLQNQLALFGERMNQVMQKVDEKTLESTNQISMSRNYKLLDQLPEKFSENEIIQLRLKYGLTGRVSYIISRWIKNGLIEKIDNIHWHKL